MPLDLTQLDADLAHLIDDLAASVTIGVQTGTGALTPIDRAQTLGMTGMESNVDAQLTVRSAQFSRPARNTPVSVTRTGGSAETYRTISVQESPDGLAWTITLTKDTR